MKRGFFKQFTITHGVLDISKHHCQLIKQHMPTVASDIPAKMTSLKKKFNSIFGQNDLKWVYEPFKKKGPGINV